jgi:hypothetical protein
VRARRPRRAALAVALALASAPAAAHADPTGSASAAQGAVSASASWQGAALGATDPRLTIVRGGVTLFDGSPVAASESCREGPCSYAASGPRDSPLQVVDLDGDGEPEVLLDAYTDGAHCCAVTEVLRYVPGGYVAQELSWGNAGYRLRDLDAGPDGRPELVTVDDSFAYEFTAFAFSRFPVRVLSWRAGTVTAVTARYPALVRADLATQRRAIRSLRRQRFDLRGAVAAYVADLYLLGRPHQARRELDRALHRGDLRGDPIWKTGRAFTRALLRFLHRHGYR